jgi:hypothetical protein
VTMYFFKSILLWWLSHQENRSKCSPQVISGGLLGRLPIPMLILLQMPNIPFVRVVADPGGLGIDRRPGLA